MTVPEAGYYATWPNVAVAGASASNWVVGSDDTR